MHLEFPCGREHPTPNLHHNTNKQEIGKTRKKVLKNRNISQHLEKKKKPQDNT
jgi:hypothetical protein